VTICLDRRNASGCIETYLEPLLYKCSLSIRLCRMFRSPHSARPYTTQMDMFCSKIAFILTEPQLPMFLRLLTLILDLNPTDTPETNNCIDDEIYNRSPSSCSSGKSINILNNNVFYPANLPIHYWLLLCNLHTPKVSTIYSYEFHVLFPVLPDTFLIFKIHLCF